MTSAKQIVYRYNGDAATDEVESDMEGELPIPQRDAFIMRKGARWKVVHINIEQTVNVRNAVPIYRVYLTSQS